MIILAKRVVEKNYHSTDPVGQSEMCQDCSIGCKTHCMRKPAHNMGSEKPFIIPEENQEKPVTKRFYEVTIKDVDSIPCSLREQRLLFDVDGNKLEGEFVTPWRMDWLEPVIQDYLQKDIHMASVKIVDLYNPEEADQLIVCEVNSYIERV